MHFNNYNWVSNKVNVNGPLYGDKFYEKNGSNGSTINNFYANDH